MTSDQISYARKFAMEMAKWINRNIQGISTQMIIEEAEQIFKWLTKV